MKCSPNTPTGSSAVGRRRGSVTSDRGRVDRGCDKGPTTEGGGTMECTSENKSWVVAQQSYADMSGWTVREQLLLIQAVFRIGVDNWAEVSRKLRPNRTHDRPWHWFAAHHCKDQYEHLLVLQQGWTGAHPPEGESVQEKKERPMEMIARLLFKARMNELKYGLRKDRAYHRQLTADIDLIAKGLMDSKLDTIEKEAHLNGTHLTPSTLIATPSTTLLSNSLLFDTALCVGKEGKYSLWGDRSLIIDGQHSTEIGDPAEKRALSSLSMQLSYRQLDVISTLVSLPRPSGPSTQLSHTTPSASDKNSTETKDVKETENVLETPLTPSLPKSPKSPHQRPAIHSARGTKRGGLGRGRGRGLSRSVTGVNTPTGIGGGGNALIERDGLDENHDSSTLKVPLVVDDNKAVQNGVAIAAVDIPADVLAAALEETPITRSAARSMGVSVEDVQSAIQAVLGDDGAGGRMGLTTRRRRPVSLTGGEESAVEQLNTPGGVTPLEEMNMPAAPDTEGEGAGMERSALAVQPTAISKRRMTRDAIASGQYVEEEDVAYTPPPTVGRGLRGKVGKKKGQSVLADDGVKRNVGDMEVVKEDKVVKEESTDATEKVVQREGEEKKENEDMKVKIVVNESEETVREGNVSTNNIDEPTSEDECKENKEVREDKKEVIPVVDEKHASSELSTQLNTEKSEGDVGENGEDQVDMRDDKKENQDNDRKDLTECNENIVHATLGVKKNEQEKSDTVTAIDTVERGLNEHAEKDKNSEGRDIKADGMLKEENIDDSNESKEDSENAFTKTNIDRKTRMGTKKRKNRGKLQLKKIDKVGKEMESDGIGIGGEGEEEEGEEEGVIGTEIDEGVVGSTGVKQSTLLSQKESGHGKRMRDSDDDEVRDSIEGSTVGQNGEEMHLRKRPRSEIKDSVHKIEIDISRDKVTTLSLLANKAEDVLEDKHKATNENKQDEPSNRSTEVLDITKHQMRRYGISTRRSIGHENSEENESPQELKREEKEEREREGDGNGDIIKDKKSDIDNENEKVYERNHENGHKHGENDNTNSELHSEVEDKEECGHKTEQTETEKEGEIATIILTLDDSQNESNQQVLASSLPSSHVSRSGTRTRSQSRERSGIGAKDDDLDGLHSGRTTEGEGEGDVSMLGVDTGSEGVGGRGGKRQLRWQRSGSSNSGSKLFKKQMEQVWGEICGSKCSNAFLQPVSKTAAPEYLKMVKCPMDLAMIKKRIDQGTITTPKEFLRDCLLVCANAIMFNNHDHEVHQYARELMVEVKLQVNRFLLTQLLVQESKDSDIDSPLSAHLRHTLTMPPRKAYERCYSPSTFSFERRNIVRQVLDGEEYLTPLPRTPTTPVDEGGIEKTTKMAADDQKEQLKNEGGESEKPEGDNNNLEGTESETKSAVASKRHRRLRGQGLSYRKKRRR